MRAIHQPAVSNRFDTPNAPLPSGARSFSVLNLSRPVSNRFDTHGGQPPDPAGPIKPVSNRFDNPSAPPQSGARSFWASDLILRASNRFDNPESRFYGRNGSSRQASNRFDSNWPSRKPGDSGCQIDLISVLSGASEGSACCLEDLPRRNFSAYALQMAAHKTVHSYDVETLRLMTKKPNRRSWLSVSNRLDTDQAGKVCPDRKCQIDLTFVAPRPLASRTLEGMCQIDLTPERRKEAAMT